MSVLLALALIAAACGSDDSSGSSDEGSTQASTTVAASDDTDEPTTTEPAEEADDPPPVIEVDPVKIGALYPLTGSAASAGEQTLNGVMLAAEIVNGEYPELAPLPLAATAGLPSLEGAQIEIASGDHAGDPQTGATETERLITDEGVVAMTGAYFSSVTTTASERAERLGVPFLNGSSSSTALTEERELDYFFRTGPSDKTFAITFFDFLQDLEERDGTELRNVSLLWENTAFGTDAAKVTRELAEEFGFNVVADISHGNEVADISPEAQQIMSAEPDVIFQASYTPEAILFTQAWDVNDYAAPTLAFGAGFSDNAFFEAVGDRGDFVIARAAWSAQSVSDKPAAAAVAAMYEERFGVPMDENSARTFTGALTLFNAINEAGTTDADAIRDAIAATDLNADETIMPWAGIKFGPTGQNDLARGIILQRIDDEYQVVWPFATADADLVWPIPSPSER